MIWCFANRNLLLKLSFVLACTVLVWSAIDVINTYLVNVPVGDYWSVVGFYEKYYNGKATFSDFIQQHNEHRILFSRLIFAPLAFMTGWDLLFEAYAVIVVILIIFLALARIGFYQQSDVLPILVPLSVLITCALLFSNIQYGSVLFPFNIQWFNVIAGASVGIFLFAWPNEDRRLLRFLLAATACTVSTYSGMNGMSTWIALLPSVIVFSRQSSFRSRWIITWFALFCITSGLYFVGYQKPDMSPDLLSALSQPIVSLRFFLVLLGRPLLPWGTVTPILIVGAVLLGAYLYFSFVYLRRFGSRLSDQYAPWLSLGLLAVIYSGMVTVGRVEFGETNALSANRYLTTTMLLAISIIHLSRLYISNRLAVIKATGRNSKPSYIVVLLYGMLLAHVIHGSYATLKHIEAYSVKYQQFEQCLELIYYAPDSCLGEMFYNANTLVQRARIAERLNFRKFAKNLVYLDPKRGTELEKSWHGYINLGESIATPVELQSGDAIKLSGWVVRPSMLEPHMVFFSINVEKPRFFTSTRVGTEIVGRHPRPGWAYTPWTVTVSEVDLPDGEHRIRAWIYDRKGKQFVRLYGEFPVFISKKS